MQKPDTGTAEEPKPLLKRDEGLTSMKGGRLPE